MGEVKFNVYENLYKKLDTKEEKEDILKLTRLKEKQSKELANIRSIKNEGNEVLDIKNEIKEKNDYFHNLHSEDLDRGIGLGDTSLLRHILYCYKYQKKSRKVDRSIQYELKLEVC